MAILSEDGTGRLEAYLYSRFSAIAHAGELGLAGFLEPVEDRGDGTALTQVGVGPFELASLTMSLVLAINLTVVRVGDYLGVDLAPWHAAWQPAPLLWRDILTATSPRPAGP